MNARSILSALVLATAASVAAQNEASLPDTRREHIYFETRLAFDVSSNTGVKPAYDVGAGFVAGGLVGIPIRRNFYFEPGLLAYYTVWSVDNERLEALKLYSGTAKNLGLRLPFNFGYTISLLDNLTVQAYIGPWLNINLMARRNLSPAPGSPFEKYSSCNLFREGFRRVDAQWGFGLKLTWSDHYVLGVSFGVGMTPVRKFTSLHNEMTQRRNSFQINLGYRF